jgi:uncharacterized protein
MAVKGNLNLEIDEQGVEVRITLTPDENGADISMDGVRALLAEKNVRLGVDLDAIDHAIRALAKSRTEPVSFLAASGLPPQAPAPETVAFEPCPIPERLAAVARRALDASPPARGFRLHEERTRVEKKVLKKAALPFLRPREEIEVEVQKRIVREDVPIDPAPEETGWVTAGTLVARLRPGTPGKPGKSVFGRVVPAPRLDLAGFLILKGLTRSGMEVRADVSGFLRRGGTWCDVVSFRDHAITVSPSRDGLSCLLSFMPGDEKAPDPDPREVLARAVELGFPGSSLLPAPEIETLMKDAVLRRSELRAISLSPRVNGAAVVAVSEDQLKATLSLRKGRGGGKPLTPAAVTEAIRSSKVRGFRAAEVKRDLLAFFAGRETELVDYELAVGRAAKPGAAAKVEWRAMFLPAAEAEAMKAAAQSSAGGLASLASLGAFPLSRVEAVARVEKDAEVLRITAGVGGETGVDVYGATLGSHGPTTGDVRLFEGLSRRGDTVITTAAGVLEKGSDGDAILLRVRPHRDAVLEVSLSPDRMKALLTFYPALGDGHRIPAAEVTERLRQAGVVKGIDQKKLAALMDRVARGEEFVNQEAAEGRPPRGDPAERVEFHVALATGKTVALRPDGRADFRSQDRITKVHKGDLIATVRPRDVQAEDGWDVAGQALTPAADAQAALGPGTGAREEVLADGSVRLFAETDGELVLDGHLVSVTDAHSVEGDVCMATGNVSFGGNVRISGAIRSGFTVMAGGVLEVGGTVEAALLSADGSIRVGLGIKGEGRAILRSKRDIEGMFAEQSVLLAIGDVHLSGPCVRSQVKCNGRLRLDSEKGSLLGGEVRASRGVEAQNIGSAGGARTVVSFGQDFLVKDQIEREEREVIRLQTQVAELDVRLFVLEKQARAAAGSRGAADLAAARAEKVRTMKLIETRKMRLITLRDRYDEHVPSEVVVRGTLYPGAIVESHGRRYETRTEKKTVRLEFDPTRGKIVEKV